ncbi:hypothetical protein ACROYT_G008437 [Oculina patagonica]
MDESSQNSFYEDNLLVSGITTEVKGHLKDERLSTFKSICQQLRVETPEPIQNVLRANDASDFTVPDCDDQKCQLEIQQDINHTTTMSNSLPREHRTVPSIEMCGERSSIVDNFKDLRVISQEYSTECAPHILPLGKSLHDSHASSQDITGKPEVSQDEVYLVWNAQGQSKIELSNKVPASWPAIGVKSIVTEDKVTPDQPTLSFFTLVKQAQLLSDEQLQQVKGPEHMPEHSDHSDQCTRSILKRNTTLNETFGSPAEKFAKMDFDTEIETSSEDREFFSQEETINDDNDHSRTNADQEVPFQEENSGSKEQAVVEGKMLTNAISTVSSFGERPSLNSEDNILDWQGSTEDHFHIKKAPFHEEPNTTGPCTESFCLKFSEKDHGKETPRKEGLPVVEEAGASSTNAKHGGGEPRLTDQLRKNSEHLEEQQTVIITNEKNSRSSHNEVHVVPNPSPVIFNIACKYPPLPQRTPYDAGLCSSLRAIDERDYITGLLAAQRLNLNDASPWEAECFDKVRLSECSDNLINEQPTSLTERAPSPTNSVCLALENNVENVNLFSDVTPEVENCHLQATCEKNPSEGPSNQGVEMQTNFLGQGNDVIITAALPGNTHKAVNVTTQDDSVSVHVMDSDNDNEENKREFNHCHEENKNLGESSGIKDVKKIINSHPDETVQFRTEIESKMIDLDGPELLQFAMIFVQGALEKSQIVPSCSEQLKFDEDNKNMSRAAPAFPWKRKISYYSQQTPSLGTTDDETFSNEAGSIDDENGFNGDTDNKEGPPHLVMPLPKTSCNRPLRLGLSRKHRNKPLHPYLKKHSNAKPN